MLTEKQKANKKIRKMAQIVQKEKVEQDKLEKEKEKEKEKEEEKEKKIEKIVQDLFSKNQMTKLHKEAKLEKER